MSVLTFIETPVFTKQITALATDEEYRRLQERLIADPEAGDLVRGGGGIRKIRMALAGRGKRGGARVIYRLKKSDATIFMLIAYSKVAKTGLTPGETAVLRTLVKAL